MAGKCLCMVVLAYLLYQRTMSYRGVYEEGQTCMASGFFVSNKVYGLLGQTVTSSACDHDRNSF